MTAPLDSPAPATVWVARISDMTPQRYLDFDVKDVLAALGPRVHEYNWAITELWGAGDEAFRLEMLLEQSPGWLLLSAEELLDAAQKIAQAYDGEFVAIPDAEQDARTLRSLLDTAAFPKTEAALVIRAVDCSFIEVFTKSEADVTAFRQRFDKVVTEDMAEYFDD